MKTIGLLLFSFLISTSICAHNKFEKNSFTLRSTTQEVKDKNSSELSEVYELAQMHKTSNVTKTKTLPVDMYYVGICSNCSNKEYQYTSILAPGEFINEIILNRTNSGLNFFKVDKNRPIVVIFSDIQSSSFTSN
ncbi:MAG: hypothetical protein ACKO5W_05055 [Crocinitomicaceae bacterium]